MVSHGDFYPPEKIEECLSTALETSQVCRHNVTLDECFELGKHRLLQMIHKHRDLACATVVLEMTFDIEHGQIVSSCID